MTTVTLKNGETYSAEKLGRDLYVGIGSLSDEELIFLLSALYDGDVKQIHAQAAELMGYQGLSLTLDSFVRLKEACMKDVDGDMRLLLETTQQLLRLTEQYIVQPNIWH
jgi:hypothetical protein